MCAVVDSFGDRLTLALCMNCDESGGVYSEPITTIEN